MARHANPRSRRSWSNYGLCCTGFRASITERPRTSALDRRQNAKWRAGEGQRGAPILTYGRGTPVSAQACGPHAPPLAQAPGWGACLSLRRRPAQRAFPRSPRRAGTQRAVGKARSAAEVCGATSDRKRPGADFPARDPGSPEPRAWSLPTFPSLPFPVLTASRDASGTQGAGAGRAGSMSILHLLSCVLMAGLIVFLSLRSPARLRGSLWLLFRP